MSAERAAYAQAKRWVDLERDRVVDLASREDVRRRKYDESAAAQCGYVEGADRVLAAWREHMDARGGS